MDPYIETRNLWSDFHSDMSAEIRAALNLGIQPRYVARVNPYIVYDTLEIAERGPNGTRQPERIGPDVAVFHREAPESPEAAASAAGLLIAPAPVISQVPHDVPVKIYPIEIRTVDDHTLVTVIEILSPVNKRSGPARKKYLDKRARLLHADVHFLEIDLLRGGERSPLEKPVPTAPYYVSLCRADRRPYAEVWPIRLSEPLPIVPVPLLRPDPDVALPLGDLVHAVYDRGAYGASIDYRQPPPPPVCEGEAAWIDRRLREAGLR